MQKTLKISRELELLIGSIGVSQALYLSLHTLLERKKVVKNILLGLFFAAVTLRITKSLLWIYFDSTPEWFINLGFLAHSAIGPLSILYIYHFIFNRKWSNWNFFHFAPSILLLFFIFETTLDNFWYLGGYAALLYHQMAYSLAGMMILVIAARNGAEKINILSKKEWIWIVCFFGSMAFLQIAYFLNYIVGMTPYLMGPVIYGILVYFLGLFVVKNPQIINGRLQSEKYKNIKLSQMDLRHYAHQVTSLLMETKPYLDNSFTIKKLADHLHLPVYLVSYVINQEFSSNFSDLLNSYRIKEATALFKKPGYHHLKISSIAYQCGFNSLSSFNIAFKKFTGMTPSTYRKRMMDLSIPHSSS